MYCKGVVILISKIVLYTVSPLVCTVYILHWPYMLQLNNVFIPNYIAIALSVDIEKDLKYKRTLQCQRLEIF